MYVLLEPVIVTFVVPSIAQSEPVPQNLEPPQATIASLTAFSVGRLPSVHGVPTVVTTESI